MKRQTSLLPALALLFLLLAPAGHLFAQKNYDLTFMEIGVGMRQFTEVPTDVVVKYDSIYQSVDFRNGKPLLLTVGAVFLPDELGLAGVFDLEIHLGASYGIGAKMGIGYKLGNDRFSFAPMFAIAGHRTYNRIGTYKLGEGGLFASEYDESSNAVFVGPEASIGGGNGADIKYQISNAIFELKPTVYLAYQISDKVSLFGNFAFNTVVGVSKSTFTADGMGYDDLVQLSQAQEPPHQISVDITTGDFMQDGSGRNITKSPLDMNGVQFSIGIGLHLPG